MFAPKVKDEEKPDGICREERKKVIGSRETVRWIKNKRFFNYLNKNRGLLKVLVGFT